MPPFTFNRNSLVRGPGTFYYGPYGSPAKTTKIFSSSGITAELDAATKPLPSDIVGDLDTIKSDQRARIRVTNTGHINQDILNLLFPWRKPLESIGQGIFGATDIMAAVHSTAGKKVTFKNVGLVRPPELILSRTNTVFGEAEFLGLIGLDGDTTADLHAIINAPYPSADIPLLTALGLTGALYTATWNGLDITGTVNGWRIGVEPELEDVQCDELGTIDQTVGNVRVTARCTPLGWDEQKILDNSPVTKGLGMSIVTDTPLVITGANGLTVTLFGAGLDSGSAQWGKTTNRSGELTFVAHPDPATGKLYDIQITPAA